MRSEQEIRNKLQEVIKKEKSLTENQPRATYFYTVQRSVLDWVLD